MTVVKFRLDGQETEIRFEFQSLAECMGFVETALLVGQDDLIITVKNEED